MNKYLKGADAMGSPLVTCLIEEFADKTDKRLLIYGLGTETGPFCNTLKAIGVATDFFLVKDDSYQYAGEFYDSLVKDYLEEKDGCWTYCGVPIIEIGAYDWSDENYYILFFSSFSKRIFNQFTEAQKRRIIVVDYNRDSSILEGLFFREYFTQKGVDLEQDCLTIGNFKVTNPFTHFDMEGYAEAFYSEAPDLILPQLLHDDSFLDEGDYERKEVCLEAGDVVFDCGANIGLFSCLAASKGCSVYAFEPVPETYKYLKENASHYDTITPVLSALSDTSGKCTMNTYKSSNSFANMNTNTEGKETPILPWIQYSDETVEADMTTVDDFVKANGLKRVDFIKADIEGAERYMLRGARETLKRLAPKLSICTYHLPDDKEVLTEIILGANPDYIIEYDWKKLYAYVPKSAR